MYANKMERHTRGAELWGRLDLTDGRRLSAGETGLRGHQRFVPVQGSRGLNDLRQARSDGSRRLSLRSATDLPRGIGFEPGPRQIGSPMGPAGPARTEIDAQSRRPVSRPLRCRFE